MKLLTKAIEKKLPEPLSTDGQGDAAIAQAVHGVGTLPNTTLKIGYFSG